MQEAKHTPTPWAADGTDICQKNNGHFHVVAKVKLFRDYDEIDIANKQSAPERHQYLVEISCPVEGTEEANAKHIAKCVNLYTELLAALRPFAEPHAMGDSYVQFAPRLIDTARAAIAKATAS